MWPRVIAVELIYERFSMANAGTLTVDLQANIASFQDGMKKAQQTMEGFQASIDRIGNFASGLLYKLPLIGGALGGAFELHGLMERAEQAEQRMARFEAVIRANGDAAKISAAQMRDFAAALASDSLFKRGDVIEAGTRLASSGRVSGDQFKQAIQAAADMATVMGEDLPSATKRLGNALADPAEGLSRLRREGVFFTNQQKLLIEQFEKTNQLAKAQQVILDQLHRQFGGAAAADADSAAGAWKRFGESFSSSSSGIGKFLSATSKDTAEFMTMLAGGNARPFGADTAKVAEAMPSQQMQEFANKTYEAADAAQKLIDDWKHADFAASFGKDSGNLAQMSEQFLKLNEEVEKTATKMRQLKDESRSAWERARAFANVHISSNPVFATEQLNLSRAAIEAAQQKEKDFEAARDAHTRAFDMRGKVESGINDENTRLNIEGWEKQAQAWRDKIKTPQQRFQEESKNIIGLAGAKYLNPDDASKALAFAGRGLSRDPVMFGALLEGTKEAYDQAYKNQKADQIDPAVEAAQKQLQESQQQTDLLKSIDNTLSNQQSSNDDFSIVNFV